ncbi:MAG: sarcosine oxidase subunit alpha family protein [Candidatus Puniceispirillum sp.]|nr:sarcosine oxidase subunit alpha family protein [Candidatus Puniceispirillum sp.]
MSAASLSQKNRIAGGLVDRSRPLGFRFDGQHYTGFAGDTLASALLANNIRLVGRSFKYHRPRGILTAGSEEPNALVTIGGGAYQDPNCRATTAELIEGMNAKSQTKLGSLSFDFMAINDFLSPLLGAGFYYKTFMWPAAFWEKLYEPIIRKAAGLGSLSGLADPDNYDKGYLHCDVLVIGSGPSGLMAALAAAESGLRVILADEDFCLGGRLIAERQQIDDMESAAFAASILARLASIDHVRILPKTNVFGAFDHGCYGALERVNEHNASGSVRQIFWHIRSQRCVLAAGSNERPIAFSNNDRPGVMLAGAVRSYVNRFGVAPGKRVAIFTNNDDGWSTAEDLHAAGVEVTAIIDSRSDISKTPPKGVPTLLGGYVTNTRGRLGLTSVQLNNGSRIPADCLAVSGGWSPNVHLTCHQRGKPVWQDAIAGFVPGGVMPDGMIATGAANGVMTLDACLKAGLKTGQQAARSLGRKPASIKPPRAADEAFAIQPFWYVKDSAKKAFVDFQNDVSVKDIKLSHQEGFRAVEHLKRYTTLGMATDQGKIANVPGLAILADISGKTIAETGTTIFRPPYTPVPIAAFAGRSRGRGFRPTRLTPSHKWAGEQAAVFVETGAWLRAQWYPKAGETEWRQSVDREVLATRAGVGVCDVTTLGKIDIQGRDAGTFLNHVYANGFAKLPIGKTRYGLMLREDGMVMDDGTTARLSETHYLMTTTTANAVAVFRHLEFAHQCLWPELDVQLISVTEQYAQYAVAGPKSRQLLEKLVDKGVDISNAAFPFMACGEISVCGGVKARLFRISFSGELAYEIAVPARYGDSLIRALMAAGEEFGVTAYGTEALGVMRVEKGHVAGNELNGQTTARQMGLGHMVSQNKDSIGLVLSRRPEMVRDDDYELVGLKPVDVNNRLTAGAHFIALDTSCNAENDQGWVTSVAHSPHLNSAIGLGYIRRGSSRHGDIVRAIDLLGKQDIRVELCSPHFIDPEGERLHG